MLTTERLILRKWTLEDAESLFEYARDPDVGPIAGWPAHQSIEESRNVIEQVFHGPECYAVCEKGNNIAIGAVELMLNGHTDMTNRDDECELGYWLFYPQLGVKLCSMAGGGVQKIHMVFLREPSRRDRSGSDLFHLWDGFEIKMNFDRNVSCFIFVNALMHDDFFD